MNRKVFALALLLVAVATQAFAFDWGGGGATAPRGTVRVLAQSAVAASVTGTTSETTLASYVLPAGAMGSNGALRVTTLWSNTNSSNNKTLQVRFNGNVTMGGAVITTTASAQLATIIRNRGVATSQIANAFSTNTMSSTGAVVTATSVNTANAVTVTITGQLASSGETITLEGYTVELLPGVN